MDRLNVPAIHITSHLTYCVISCYGCDRKCFAYTEVRKTVEFGLIPDITVQCNSFFVTVRKAVIFFMNFDQHTGSNLRDLLTGELQPLKMQCGGMETRLMYVNDQKMLCVGYICTRINADNQESPRWLLAGSTIHVYKTSKF